MVRVPEYQRDVSLRPILQSEMTVRANAEHFGAAVGRGMQQAARGMESLAASMNQVRELEDGLRAKEADDALAEWDRNAKYGEGGFMTLEGRNAVDGRGAYEEAFERKRKELGAGLTPGAARMYDRASRARQQSSYDQSIRHSAAARKQWFNDATTHRLNTFSEDAIAAYNDQDRANTLIAAGQAEIRQQAKMMGWDDAVRINREKEFISDTRYNTALRMAIDDPLAAQRYYEEHKDQLTGPHQANFEEKIKTPLLTARVSQHAARFQEMRREAPAAGAGGDQGGSGGAGPEAPARAPAGSQGQRTIGQTGPSKARAYLQSRSNKPSSHVDGLSETFAQNLAAMIQDAPPEIREGLGVYSGYRSVERQRELWAGALKKYGSAAAARKWVAPPGNSNHNYGNAVDLSYNGQSLRHAPQHVKDWVHQNARKYGMHFPMGHEPWHIEPLGTRGTQAAGVADRSTVAPTGGVTSPRVNMPSYDQMEAFLSTIENPAEREMTRKAIIGNMEMQVKLFEAQQKEARVTAFNLIETQGINPFQLPPEVTTQIGMDGMTSLMNYWEKRQAGEDVQTDPTFLYDMRRYAATDPENFAKEDLSLIFDQLGKEDRKELTKLQTDFLSDPDAGKAKAINLTSAFSQASSALEAVGLATAGKTGTDREETARRIALFQNALALEMQAFQQANENRPPNQMEIQSMINRLLLPVVMKQERSIWNPLKTPWSSHAEIEGMRLFDTGNAPEDAIVDVDVEYTSIPLEDRARIETEFTEINGRLPTRDEVETMYNLWLKQAYGLDAR
jgi:hypothetical protein